MLKRLAVLSVFAIGSVAIAHADSINLFGNDGFTSSTITFGSAIIGGTSTGIFSPFTFGNAVTMFPTEPGVALPYSPGFQTVMSRIGVPSIEALTSTEAGITVDFFLTDYTTAFDTLGNHGCTVAQCLTVGGDGFFTVTGVAGTTPGSFTFTTQETADDLALKVMTPTTFSASGFNTPEPESLVLLGTGLLGVVGIMRRRVNV